MTGHKIMIKKIIKIIYFIVMSFSLAGLDDHLTPSQQCVKPLQVLNRSNKKQNSKPSPVSISIDDRGGYYETNEIGEKKLLDEVQISLNDCLACRLVNTIY